MKYLLDTNIVSDMMHNPQGRVMASIARVGEDNVFTSILVVSEVRYGIEKRGSQRLANRLLEILEGLPVERFEAPADEHYAFVRNATKSRGTNVGQMDLLIAAQARALDVILVTGNEREFSYVPGLKVENWLK
jgi:tRNA(fMet)-specific endonuclease VapC